LATSFSAVGLFVATIGYGIGLDNDALQTIGAALMLAVGGVLVTPPLQIAFASATAPLSTWANARTASFAGDGLWGQAGLGALLGLVWSPCVGPTLGAATVLAAQGANLAAVALVMALFGLGAAIALTLIGYGARAVLARHRGALRSIGEGGKSFLGWTLVLVAALVLTGFDQVIETALVDLSPAWLTELTTRF
jgi:cytochrome c biogenesis protein CcdA